MNNVVGLILSAALLCFTSVSHADSFQGTAWSLSGVALADSDPLHESYRVTLGVDTNGYTGTGSFLDQVAIKISSAVYASSLFDAPVGASAWALTPGGISSGGCSEAGAGFVCANSLSTLSSGMGVSINAGNGVGDDYSWVFDITVNNGGVFTAAGAASVKARFVNTAGNKVGDLVSEPMTLNVVTAVPEPETYAMLLAGLGLVGAWVRRRPSQPA
jgi:hypothetical protein